MRLLSFLLLGVLWLAPASAQTFSWTFATIPADGVVSGNAGDSLGWGYQITNNDPNNWLVTANLNPDSFSSATTTSLFDFPILAPLQTVTAAFDPVAETGLFEAVWDGGTAPGSTNMGDFTLSADWYDNDPTTIGAFIMNATDQLQSYAMTLESAPEPPASVLLALGLAGLWVWCGIAVKQSAGQLTQSKVRSRHEPFWRLHKGPCPESPD